MGKTTSAAKFQVGDWVTFTFGTQPVAAQIIEDRGPLGVGGQRIYRIRLDRSFTEPDMFEITEDDVEQVLRKDDLLQYLKRGGLVKILQRNLSGGKHPPRVWLTLSPKGEITHTPQESLGLIGGETVPFFALEQDKIFSERQDPVLDFLASFGLTKQEAKDVVRTVGTAP